MIGIICLIFYTCIASAHGQTDCTNLKDGHYSITCKTYDVCQNHVVTHVDCDAQKKVYNNVTKECDYVNHVLPPCGLVRDCTGMKDGSHADKTLHCNSYYTCSHEVYYGHNFCTPGTVFEETIGTCVWPDEAYKPCGNKNVTK